MKQLKLACLLASFMNLFGVKALAYEFAYNGIYYDWDYTHGVTGFQVTFKSSTYSEAEFRDIYYSDYSGDITIPSTVTYYGKSYPVVSIGDHAFSRCEYLTSVVIPSSVSTIGEGAFEYCKSFSLILPNSVKRIESYAFLADYTVEDYELSINISDLKAWFEMDIVDGIQRPYRLYLNGSLVTNIDIPEGITTIHNYAFSNCCQITEINIPEGVTSIGEYAFRFTISEPQVTVTLPSSITSIGYSAFDSYLTSVTIKRESPSAISWGAFSNTSQATLYVPAGCKAAYETADYWKDFKEIVEIQEENSIINFADANVKALCVTNWDTDGDGELSKDEASSVTNLKYVFKDRLNITSFDELQYFTGLTNINTNAFYGCSGLTRITLPTSLTSIGEYSFGGCSSLTSITIPSSVKSIGSWAFAGSGLSSVVFPNGLTSIGSYAFHGTDITSVAIPSSVTNIGEWAFNGCSNLVSVTMQRETPVSIDAYTFSNRANATLYVPYGSKSAYEAADYWKEFKEIVEMKEVIEPTDISKLTDAIYANETFGLKGGTATLTINMKNDQTTNAYSFDLKLPEGVILAKDNNDEYIYTLSSRHNGHSATVNYNEASGVYSFAVLSLQSKEIKESDGVIWTLKLNLSNDIEIGDYPVKIQNAKYSLTTGSTSVTLPDVISLLTIENYKQGDANGDNSIDIADAVCIVNHVVGKATPAYVDAAADANGDGVVDIADAVRIVNWVVGKIGALTRPTVWNMLDPQ